MAGRGRNIGYDVVIADVGGAVDGEWSGIYGESYDNLGLDMIGDVRLGDLPVPGPRADVPTSANVVVQAVAQKVAEKKMTAPEKPLTKPTMVVRKGVTPLPFKLPPIDKKKVMKIAAVGIAAYVLYTLAKGGK